LVPSATAIAGSDVAITVESMFSMNKATATISGTTRSYEGGGALSGILDFTLAHESLPKTGVHFRDHALSACRAGFEALQAFGRLLE
jgi:hypothetical protein